MRFLAQTPDFSVGLAAFTRGYAHYLLGEAALADLEDAARDAGIRRVFFADLLEALIAELVAVERYGDAERYVVEIAAEQGRQDVGRELVARIRASRR